VETPRKFITAKIKKEKKKLEKKKLVKSSASK
jgi:hypothetical protein